MKIERKNCTYFPAAHDAAIDAGYADISYQITIHYPNTPENNAVLLRAFCELSTPGKYPFMVEGCAFGYRDLNEIAPAEWKTAGHNPIDRDVIIEWRPAHVLIQPNVYYGDFLTHKANFDAFMSALIALLPPEMPKENDFTAFIVESCIHFYDDDIEADLAARSAEIHGLPVVYNGKNGRLVCAGHHIGFMPSRNRSKYYVLPGWQVLLLADAARNERKKK